jgi:hypothetical protein
MLVNPQAAFAMADAARKRLEQEFDLWTTTRCLHGLIACGEHAGAAEGVAAAPDSGFERPATETEL